MYARCLNLKSTLKRKSVLILGPRQTGKSTWIRQTFRDAHYIDLLQPGLFQELTRNPDRLGEIIALESKQHSLFIIDEIQSIPILMNEVHRWIEKNKSLRFLLTGSSARKLRRSGGNLLGGRLARFHFHPLCELEARTGDHPVSWERRLEIGALPAILTSPDPFADLRDYVGVYLKEEIRAEGLSRSIDNFSRFLEAAALCQAEQINFAQIANDAQLPPRTVVDYFSILEDTLIGQILPAYTGGHKRKAMTTAKFYLFDIGVGNALLQRHEIPRHSSEFGKVLEQLIFLELRAYRDYIDQDLELYYWRSLSMFEVDFVIKKGSKFWAIEVKASKNPSLRDYRGLFAFSEEQPKLKKICVCTTAYARETEDGVTILPVQRFLTDLWSHTLLI